MQNTVEIRSFLVELKKGVVVEILLAWLLRGEYHFYAAFQFLLCKFLVKPLEIERIADKILVDIAKELVAFECAEPLNPTDLGVGVCWFV